MDILNLDEYKLLKVEESEHDYALQVQTKKPYFACQSCFETQKIRKFGTLSVIYMDLPIHGKRVGIHIERQRYQCKSCGKTYFETLPEMDERRQCTKRLIDWLIQESFKQSFVALADQTGLNESTIRRIFEKYAKSQNVDLPARKAVKALENLDSFKLADESDQQRED